MTAFLVWDDETVQSPQPVTDNLENKVTPINDAEVDIDVENVFNIWLNQLIS